MPSAVKMRSLLETGVHFGHRTNKWNPKMNEFIFTQRNGIHIIDLQITLKNLNHFHDMIAKMIADSGSVLFVGTKRQAQEIVQREAGRCGMPLCELPLAWRYAHQLEDHPQPYRHFEAACAAARRRRV